MRFRPFLASLAAALIAFASVAAPAIPAFAQTYPSQTPTYIPTATVAATTCSAACDVTFVTNGVSTATVRVSGSGTGVAAIVQGTNERSSPNWTTLSVHPIGTSGSGQSIAGTGFWRVNTAGLTSIRVHLTAVTGSVSIAMAATPDAAVILTGPERKATYSASITGLAPASSATDFFTLSGSATTTVRVQEVRCSGISTAAATASVIGLVRSTADTSGTSTSPTAVPHDSNSPAATGAVKAYTANPTTGTLTGNIRAGLLTTNTAASSAFNADALVWQFGAAPAQEVVLRGATQVFALNGNGASFTSGAALNCSVTWTEE